MAACEVRYEAATQEHVDELTQTMREEDVVEVLAAGYANTRVALEASVRASEHSLAVLFDGEVAALCGVRTISSGPTALGPPARGVFWILTGEPVTRHPRAFLKHSRELVAALLSYCPHLVNFIDARHQPALRMAQWMGFELAEAVPLGPAGELFVPFSVRR